MSLSYTTITGDFIGGDQQPLSGTVTFTPSQSVYSAGQEIVTPDVPIAGQITDGHLLSESGGALQLLATDNAGLTYLTLSGFFFWTVVVTTGGLTEPPWSFGLPSSPSTVDLFALANMPFSGGSGGVASVTAADASVVVGGTGTAPTVRTGTLDVVATQHPPAANWSNNSHKITSVANGSASTDVAAFGQVPTSAGSIGGLLAASNLSDLASAPTARTNLGLGSAATQPSSAFDASGSAAAVQSLAALRASNLSDLASASTARTNLGLGGAAVIGVPVSLANGGTGQATQQAAINALAGAVTAGRFLRGDGSNVTLAAIQAADVPTLNQSTSGNAATATNLAGGATFPAYVAPKVVTLTQSGGNVVVDASVGNVFALTLTASGWTLQTPTNLQDGEPVRVRLIQDATGSRTLSYSSGWDFGAAGAPVLSTVANKVDYLVGEYNAALAKVCVSAALGF